MERSSLLLEFVRTSIEQWNASVLLIISDSAEFIEKAIQQSKIPVVVATGDATLGEAFRNRARAVLPAPPLAGGGVGALAQAREVLVAAFLDGTIKVGDKAVCISANGEALDSLMLFDVERDVELTHLYKELEGRVKPVVVERVLRIAGELAREGREGKPIGTLFVIGDADAVLDRSRQVVINPFQGHPEKERSILLDSVTETVKEFALIDGAFVIGSDGAIVAAGRYIDMDKRVPLQPGLGGRHLAAASITKATKAVAVAVSSSGTIRVFKDGRVILLLGKV
ncbi:MAG: DNA integrity scanning protein DisA nucleotide-binding domain protein [Thermoplasmatota archaeon]